MQANIGGYFEIPVLDLDRAISFYQELFRTDIERGSIHGYEMAFFPFEDEARGISGALVKGDVYKPSIDGIFIYFQIENIDDVLAHAITLGSKVLLPKTEADSCYVAEITDSEGNRICLKQDF